MQEGRWELARHARTLLAASCLLLLGACAHRGPAKLREQARTSPSARVRIGNAYGDTLWFDSGVLTTWPRNELQVASAQDSIVSIRPSIVTPGTPIVMVTRGRAARLDFDTLIERIAMSPQRIDWPQLTDTTKEVSTYELGRHGPFTHPTSYGLDLYVPADWSSPIRMMVIVAGRPDSAYQQTKLRLPKHETWARSRRDSDPYPLQADLHLRPYSLTGDDLRATARLVGEVLVDVPRRRITPLKR